MLEKVLPLTHATLLITELIVPRKFQLRDFSHQSPHQTLEKVIVRQKNTAESRADECGLMKQTSRLRYMMERELKQQRGGREREAKQEKDGTVI